MILFIIKKKINENGITSQRRKKIKSSFSNKSNIEG